ncbi:MAG: hypothetical protein KDC70_00215 [Saprospiraceae bacterium]|nr:hypothetical protein [Saprospiraceae bacterium]
MAESRGGATAPAFLFSTMACYDNIIGLARADCPCFSTAPPSGYNTSVSGLYISDLEPLNTLKGYDECGETSIWTILSKARDEAVRVFKADTNAMLAQNFAPRRQRFVGQIGDASGRDTLTTDKTYAGIRIACNPTRGGTLRITHIGTLFSGSGTLSVSVYNSLNVQVVAPFDVPIVNGWVLDGLSEVIELPLYVDFDRKHEYFIVYTYDASNKPRLNGLPCGCGGAPVYYDQNRPLWGNGSRYIGDKGWANWIMVGGWAGDTLTDFDQCPATSEGYMNGLALKVELGCDISQILCSGTLDFDNDPMAMSLAYAILWKSAEIMANKMLISTDLTRENVINREAWKDLRKYWNSKYEEAIKYIAQEASINGQNDCLGCREDRMIGVKTNLV